MYFQLHLECSLTGFRIILNLLSSILIEQSFVYRLRLPKHYCLLRKCCDRFNTVAKPALLTVLVVSLLQEAELTEPNHRESSQILALTWPIAVTLPQKTKQK